MQIKSITVNAAGMTAAEQGMQGNRNQLQPESSMFGPECRVTISREGRSLSRQQKVQEETGAHSVKEERMLLRRQKEAELSKEIREGYRESLNEIDKQITDYNSSYARFEKDKVIYDAELMEKTLEEQQELMQAMNSQKQFQMEEGQRRAKEAQQMAMESAQYKEQIDENNRDLLTLLRTVEESEKAEDKRENGETGNNNGSQADIDMSDAANSMGGIIQGSAIQLMTSSINRDEDVQELLETIEESAHWFINTADSITQNILQKSSEIRASLDNESFTDQQIAEMMHDLQDGIALNYDNVKNFRAFGIQVLRDVQEAKLQQMGASPLTDLQETKKSMMLSAADAALGEARHSGLDKTSHELAEEVRDLIDKRNDVDKIQQDKEKDNKEKEEDEEDHPDEYLPGVG